MSFIISEKADAINDSTYCTVYNPLLPNATQYLFPFVMEYSLIAIAIYAGFYDSLNILIHTDLMKSLKRAIAHKQSHDCNKHEKIFFHQSHTVCKLLTANVKLGFYK